MKHVIAIAMLKHKPVVTYIWWSDGSVSAKESAFHDTRGIVFFNHVARQDAHWSNEDMFYPPSVEGDDRFDERLSLMDL